MNNYDSEWIEGIILKNPNIPVIEIDYSQLENMNIETILGKDFIPRNKKPNPSYRSSPFSDTYSSRPKL
jgi:hypothetical protein